MRFMGSHKELTPAMLARFTQVDYDREMALIAVVHEEEQERQIGVGRYIIDADGESCEFAIVVSEAWQGSGLGRYLMLRLIELARSRGLKTMIGQVLTANSEMLRLATALGFTIEDSADDHAVKNVRLSL
jgi:acetyltransferase